MRKTLLESLADVYPDSSKTRLRQMLQSGRVRVNGEIEKNAKREIDADDSVEIMTKTMQRALPPELSILFEDEHVIVVLKVR